MASRFSSRGGADRLRAPRRRGRAGPACIALLAFAAAALTAQAPDRQAADALARRAADRLTALQQEAESLARQERTLLVELRRLEVDREIKVEKRATIERSATDVRAKLAAASARAQALAGEAERQRPDIDARLVRLYKLGRAGYWRLLLDVTSLRDLGRAYRTAAALDRIDRDRVEEHRRTLAALNGERAALQTRATELERLEVQARRASDAVQAAVDARTVLVKRIDERRDLNAQLAGELQDAQRRLQGTIAQLAAGREAPPAALPLRPFRGALPWPAEGVVSSRFGTALRGSPVTAKNGIQLSLPEGEPVRAVHDGVVAFADAFSGYGNLVIVDHGDKAYSLYGHLATVGVKKGDRVDTATTLGMTGRDQAGNPALYFELRVDGTPVDPLQWLKRPYRNP
ncbi:MAG TPA: peptidoglycan DD-metalloendopeptidase family protein [Vicinamibacterales bacterium]|jgi:septal ring factor EnvC (AmiA/AmiB activator)